jgi:uncharacterized protein (DUF1800 family)
MARSKKKIRQVPVYRGKFGYEQAERLLWRAGTGPRPGEIEKFAQMNLREAVYTLTRPKPTMLYGPGPVDEEGTKITPEDAWGHDHIWWLDRMVRTSNPLQERMTLVWHDWFATSKEGVGPARLMIAQNKTLRQWGMKDFRRLILEVTRDPAMLIWLSGSSNNRWSPNENYARELMELFTLGAGRGYTERDVRSQARALTGYRNDWNDSGPVRFRYDREYHDSGDKRIFGKTDNYNWKSGVELCLRNPKHASFFVKKLWSYFIPNPPTNSTRLALESLYRRRGYDIRPVLEAIFLHPEMHEGARMTKPPVVYIAGMLRSLGRTIDTDAWSWISGLTGQYLFLPPSVAGWDNERWIDTATYRGRWIAANTALQKHEIKENKTNPLLESSDEAIKKALNLWGNPTLSNQTQQRLTAFSQKCDQLADHEWKRARYPTLRQNALRILIATSPDYQTC